MTKNTIACLLHNAMHNFSAQDLAEIILATPVPAVALDILTGNFRLPRIPDFFRNDKGEYTTVGYDKWLAQVKYARTYSHVVTRYYKTQDLADAAQEAGIHNTNASYTYSDNEDYPVKLTLTITSVDKSTMSLGQYMESFSNSIEFTSGDYGDFDHSTAVEEDYIDLRKQPARRVKSSLA